MNPLEAILKAADETGEALLAMKVRNSKLESEYREVREELGLVKRREAHLIEVNNDLREGWNATSLFLDEISDSTRVKTLEGKLWSEKMTLAGVRGKLQESDATLLSLHRQLQEEHKNGVDLKNRLHTTKMTLGNVRKLLGEESKRREALARQLADALSQVSRLQKENSGLQAEIDTLYGDDQC